MVALVTVMYSHMFSAGAHLGLILLCIHSDGGSEQTLVCVGSVEFPFSPEAVGPLRGLSPPPCDVSAHKVVFMHSYLCVCLLLLLSSADPLT